MSTHGHGLNQDQVSPNTEDNIVNKTQLLMITATVIVNLTEINDQLINN